MMDCTWDPSILLLPNCGAEVKGEVLIWHGPRVRMGICEGQPTSVTPHTTSGRADYFGPVVNRHAYVLSTALQSLLLVVACTWMLQLISMAMQCCSDKALKKVAFILLCHCSRIA